MAPTPPRSTWRPYWRGSSCRASRWRRPARGSAGNDGKEQVAGPRGVVEEEVALGQDAIDVGRGLAVAGVAVVAREVAGADVKAQPVAGQEDVRRRP